MNTSPKSNNFTYQDSQLRDLTTQGTYVAIVSYPI